MQEKSSYVHPLGCENPVQKNKTKKKKGKGREKG